MRAIDNTLAGLGDLQRDWQQHGVVHLPGALGAAGLALARRAFAWSLQHPGPGARDVLAGLPGAFYQDHANPQAYPAYRALLCDTGLAARVASIMGSQQLWLLYEQIWHKQGGALPTPWHQDLPYVPMAGPHLATVWLSLEPVARAHALEFVRGSHRGPLYNPTAFDPQAPQAAMFAADTWPPLPDIASQREAWPIQGFTTEPGDLLMFHPAILHGGGATPAQGRRRTLSLRFFGDQAYCAPRPEAGLHENDRLVREDRPCDPMASMARQPEGTLFRHPGFAQVLPATAAGEGRQHA